MATPTTDENASTLIANSFKSPAEGVAARWPQSKKNRQELHSCAWMEHMGRLCTDGLDEDSATPGSDLLERSKAFAVPSTSVTLHELLTVAKSKADLKLTAPVTKKQQKCQLERINLCLQLPSHLVQEELREFGLPSQRPVAYLEAWFMHQVKSHPRSTADFERRTAKLFWADQDEDRSQRPGPYLLMQDMLGLLPTLQANPAWVRAAVTTVWANAETTLISNHLFHGQLLTFLEDSWLMGSLSIESIVDLFSSLRLFSFRTIPFYQTLAQLFLSPDRVLRHIFLQHDQDDCTKLLHYQEAHGLTASLKLEPVPAAADYPTEILGLHNTMSTAWHILRTPTQDVAVASTWRQPVEELANNCTVRVLQLYVTCALDQAVAALGPSGAAGWSEGIEELMQNSSSNEVRQLREHVTAFLLAFLDAMPRVLVPRNSPTLLEALHWAAAEHSFSQPLRYHSSCTMHSQIGLLFEHVLCELVQRQYLTMTAACGLVRCNYTKPCTSLAMTDLRTARFFLWMLSKGAAASQSSADQTDLACMYTCSGVSLAQLLPQDLCAHPEWLDLYLGEYEGLKHLVLQQLPKYSVKPGRKHDPAASFSALRACLFRYQHPQDPVTVVGLNTFIVPPADFFGTSKPVPQLAAVTSLLAVDFILASWPCPSNDVLLAMAQRLIFMHANRQLPSGQEADFHR
ncbi:hypothetical protein WJX74_000582 [Apatococcus lobatus]|uniref:Uncharacterized protein n=1 Tax=Apatococcus lobatus TaxID=904363 RepID=A0AAW1RXT0_9CHLO